MHLFKHVFSLLPAGLQNEENAVWDRIAAVGASVRAATPAPSLKKKIVKP